MPVSTTCVAAAVGVHDHAADGVGRLHDVSGRAHEAAPGLAPLRLEGLREDIESSTADKVFIVIHSYTNHGPAYNTNYPPRFEVFTPVCNTVEMAKTSQEELFKTCDVVSLHIPATAETRQSINYDLVGTMKKGAILVNTARKEVIDEAGLLKLMAERTDLKYITDIKPDADEQFAAFEGRYFSTPKKMGAQTAEANINAGIAAAKQINAFFAEGSTRFQVNKKW